MKILVISGRFGISGVPLAQMRLARALAGRKHQVDLVYGKINENSIAPIINNVNVFSFEKRKVSQLVIPLIKYFLNKKPDIVFTAGDHLNIIVLIAMMLSGSKAKVSCSSRVTPYDTYSKNVISRGFLLKIFFWLTKWRGDVFTCVSEDMVLQYQNIFKNSPHVCVYNIVDDKYSRVQLEGGVIDEWLNDKKCPVIVAAGSLVPWKGFSDLLFAMQKVVTVRTVKLIVLGEGPERIRLSKLISDLGLESDVRLIGNVENPLAYFSKSDVFVLTSYVEGLPNVLVEAMLCGCSPVAINCPTGPREVLQDGKIGQLINSRNPEKLSEAIVRALDNPVPREVLSKAVLPFSEDVIIARHSELLGLVL